jgi:hypothetical protein
MDGISSETNLPPLAHEVTGGVGKERMITSSVCDDNQLWHQRNLFKAAGAWGGGRRPILYVTSAFEVEGGLQETRLSASPKCTTMQNNGEALNFSVIRAYLFGY